MADKNYSFKQSSDIGRLDGELHPCTHTTVRGVESKFTQPYTGCGCDSDCGAANSSNRI